jgi:hypothetical protein
MGIESKNKKFIKKKCAMLATKKENYQLDAKSVCSLIACTARKLHSSWALPASASCFFLHFLRVN